MNDNLLELIGLIRDNPTLPVYAWASGDDMLEEGYQYPAKLQNPKIRRYARVDSYGYYNCSWVFEDDDEDYFEYLINSQEYDDLSEEDAEEKVKEEIKNLDWQTAIFIDAPVI